MGWCSMVWYGVEWYGMVRYGMELNSLLSTKCGWRCSVPTAEWLTHLGMVCYHGVVLHGMLPYCNMVLLTMVE